MILSRFTPGESPLSKPWGVVLGMIERQRMIDGMKPDAERASGFIVWMKEDLWCR